MKVVVMGAGLAGVTTAWYLARDGHEVVVIDREPEVAAAASYANTGIIAASRAYPQQVLHELAREIGFDGLRRGVLYLYRNARSLDEAWERGAAMRALGCEVQRLEPEGVRALEPAIDAARITADLVSGQLPAIDLEGLRIRRH